MSSRIRSVEGLLPDAYDRTLMGVVVGVGNPEVLKVNVQGNVIAANWSDPMVVKAGDTVLVHLGIGRTGHTEAFVRAKVTSRPRPERGTVTVVPPSSDTVTVQGSDGNNYTARFVTSYTPTVGHNVLLSWWGAQPNIIGQVAATPAPAATPPPPPAPAPPPPPVTGLSVYAAGETNTLWPPGGWGSWAGGNGRVYQGSYGSGQVYGAAFYHGSPSQLAGRTIDRVRFTLGPRISAGSFNSPVQVHVYLTSNASRPGGDVSVIDGPWNIVADPGQGLRDYDLPGSWGAHFLNGAGLSFRGDPYAGFRGRNEHPDAFKLILDWRM